MQYEMKLLESRSMKQAPRGIPISQRVKVDEIIRESFNPCVSPAVLVRKKYGILRFYVDCRKLNAVTVKDSYPLLRRDDLLDQLSGNSWHNIRFEERLLAIEDPLKITKKRRFLSEIGFGSSSSCLLDCVILR